VRSRSPSARCTSRAFATWSATLRGSTSSNRRGMPKLLLEIGCEEMPAAACMEAGLQLPGLAQEHLGVVPDELWIAPRRLAFPATVPERTEDVWLQGPPESLRDKAAAGFARRHGVGVDALTVRDGFLGLEVPGVSIEDALPDRLAAIVTG